MLTHLYVEALLVDEDLADHVWEAWNANETDDQTACIAWMLIGSVCSDYAQSVGRHNDV